MTVLKSGENTSFRAIGKIDTGLIQIRLRYWPGGPDRPEYTTIMELSIQEAESLADEIKKECKDLIDRFRKTGLK